MLPSRRLGPTAYVVYGPVINALWTTWVLSPQDHLVVQINDLAPCCRDSFKRLTGYCSKVEIKARMDQVSGRNARIDRHDSHGP
jgi:hypothetical protein